MAMIRGSYVAKLAKPVKVYESKEEGDPKLLDICEFELCPKNSHLHIPISKDQLEVLYFSIQDALYGNKVTA